MNNPQELLNRVRAKDPRAIGRAITILENRLDGASELLRLLDELPGGTANILGVTGPPGSGKSTLTDQLILAYRSAGDRVGVVAVDPSSPVHQGALLGDRVRMMRHATDPNVVIRSMASRNRLGGLCAATNGAARILEHSGCQTILIETVGVGQTEMDIARTADLTILVLAPGLGDDIQAMKSGLIELADILLVNKADRPGADLLMTEMETVARETGQLVCLACALEGKGIDALRSAAGGLFQRLVESGERGKRREAARGREILDRAIELLTPQLEAHLRALAPFSGDRGQLANQLIEKLRQPKQHE